MGEGPVTRSKTAHHRKTRGVTPVVTGEDEFPVLKRLGLYAASIKGDGNCLFRSLSDQYYGDNGQRYSEIRATVVQYMMEHAESFEMFFGGAGIETWDSYIKRMATDGVYGDNLEIVAFARRYRANVVIYQNDFMYIVSCVDGQQDTCAPLREVHIAYHTWEHYSSVRNLAGPHSGEPKVSPSEPVAIEKCQSSDTSDATVPKWKIDVVKKSIPYAATPQVEDEIVRLLIEKKGDIGATVEVLVMADVELELNDGNDEVDSVAREPDNETGHIDLDLDSGNNGNSEDQQQDQVYNSTSKLSEPPRKKPLRGAKRVTARERKERQKREALERKKRKLANVPERSQSVPASNTAPSTEERSDDSSHSTPGTISQYVASSDLRTMYI